MAGDGERIADWARCLRVGVTGHRLARLDGASLSEIEASIGRALAAIQAALPGSPALHLVSSLAEGADSIAADAALALGWRLDAVLPLPGHDYAEDFTAGMAREAHLRRVAAATAVFELPALPDAEDRTTAYERAGRVMLAQSDVVVAVWDGQPARGRGGAAQIIAEAVLRGIPVIHVDPGAPSAPELLWDGLAEHDFGQQTIDTMPRGGMDRLPELVDGLVRREADPLADRLLVEVEAGVARRRWRPTLAWPLLLATMGVRRPRRTDLAGPAGPRRATHRAPDPDAPVEQRLATWFRRADAQAVYAARTFRSTYVTSFALAALSVVLSLSTLALPSAAKPFVAAAELLAIGGILTVIRLGRRGHWHRRWLDQRHLAERLRCFLIAHRLGELGLRQGHGVNGGWVSWAMRAAGRMAGLPHARVDARYLEQVRAALIELIDGQIAYLRADAERMHLLEHRMHRLGGALFAATALVCVGTVLLQLAGAALHLTLHEETKHSIAVAATIAAAGLPACGAAIYGIRMQGDFAGVAERASVLADKLVSLRASTAADPLRFDALVRHTRRASELLTEDLASWLHAYRARPLALPG